MSIIVEQLQTYPLMALFLALGLGYLVGLIRMGKFTLGGIAGTLLVAVLIGQVGGIAVNGQVKSIFFALFIFMVGYIGGPQFFAAFNRSSLKFLFSSFLMTFVGLLVVLGLAIWAGLDRGLAAGLAAGGLTQSSIIGTAGNAIDHLGLVASEAARLKTNVAVGYSVTYIFGSLGPILMVSILPIILKWDIRKEAIKLAEKISGGAKELKEGEFFTINRVTTRGFRVASDSKAAGMQISDLEESLGNDVVVESLVRNEVAIEFSAKDKIASGDILIMSGPVRGFKKLSSMICEEIDTIPESLNLVEEHRKVILTNKKIAGNTLQKLHDEVDLEMRHGVAVAGIKRAHKSITPLPGTELSLGDELTLTGHPKDLNRISDRIGYKVPDSGVTDYAVMGLAMVVGYLIGETSFKLAGTSIALGSGLGCLVSGLILGFLKSRHPRFGSINHGAANFLQSLGLAVFVGVVGLNAGAPALEAIKQHGITLFFLGVLATMLPMIIVFILNYYLLRIKNPVDALAIITGGRSANPGFAALIEKTGNGTPTAIFTMGYAVANIFLTLWGPVIIAIIK